MSNPHDDEICRDCGNALEGDEEEGLCNTCKGTCGTCGGSGGGPDPETHCPSCRGIGHIRRNRDD